jgi:hypothetical protein
MTRKMLALSLASLLLSSSAALAIRPRDPIGGGGGSVTPRPPRPIMPIPERPVTDVDTVYFLMSQPEVVKVLGKAVSRHGLKISQITSWRRGRGPAGYRIHLSPKVVPPHGIHGGGFFTVTVGVGADDRPEIKEVSDLVLAR